MAGNKNNKKEQANPPAPPATEDLSTLPVVDPETESAPPVDPAPADEQPPVDEAPSADPPVDEDPAVDEIDLHAGLAPLLAPDDATSCSFDGKEYVVEDDGVVYVPAEAVAALLSHGFEPLDA